MFEYVEGEVKNYPVESKGVDAHEKYGTGDLQTKAPPCEKEYGQECRGLLRNKVDDKFDTLRALVLPTRLAVLKVRALWGLRERDVECGDEVVLQCYSEYLNNGERENEERVGCREHKKLSDGGLVETPQPNLGRDDKRMASQMGHEAVRVTCFEGVLVVLLFLDLDDLTVVALEMRET